MASTFENSIVFVASCNVDLVSYVERMPKVGETIMGKKFQSGFGGKGANKAIAASRLGSKCAIIAKLGNDVFGRDYLENLVKNQIDTKHVFITDEAATGVAPIIVDQNGENSIIVILGANLLLSKRDIEACSDLINKTKILVTNLEIPFETASASLQLAKSSGVQTILNFAPAIEQFDKRVFKYVDYLILNEVECQELSQVKIKEIDQAKEACSNLLDRFEIQVGVVVTLGERGIIYLDRKQRKFFLKKSDDVKVVDTSGAGDAFVGAFAHYLNKFGDERIEKALELATEYASLTVQSLGTQSSYEFIENLDDRFK